MIQQPAMRSIVWCTLVSLFLLGCSRPLPEFHQTLFVFGTLVEITIVNEEPERATSAAKRVDEKFQLMHKDWHAWKPGGELAILNEHIAAGQSLLISETLLPLLTQSKQLYQQSDGLFNPAIGALIDLWGFHSDELPEGPPPEQDEIQVLLDKRPGMDDLQFEGNQVSSTNPFVQLDLGGYAKGYALDDAITILRSRGVANAIVNAGGDLCVSGRHGERPWRIGIRHPQGKGVLASLDAQDGECVLTSGNYERYREHDGKRYPHILDPRTGKPVRHIASATVIHGDGGTADAAATALTVAGPDHWFRIAKQMGLKYVMVVDEAGTVYMNPQMAERIVFEGAPPADIVLSDPL